MPRFDRVVECDVPDSFRVQQVAGMFDVPLATKSSEHISGELPDDDDWKIGVIAGPSGSGKSTIAAQAFGGNVYRQKTWHKNKAIVDCFGDTSIKEITELLTAVGFSSPPAWVRPYHVLSNGQKFRCDLARAMLENKGLVVFDEFTSVVDRTVAKIGSAAVAKAVRSGRSCEKFVAVTCHYDVIDWLEPDWVLDMASGQLARGRLWRRPEIRIRIYKSAPEHWRLFAKHHYLDSKDLRGGVTCYMAEFDNCPVCFVAVRSSIGRVGVRRISRIVTMPDFQGVGIGMAVLNAVSELILRAGAKRVRITTGHPAMMRGLQRSKRWRCDNFQKLGASHIGKSGMQRINGSSSRGRAVAHFEFQPSAGSEIAPCSQPKELAH